MAKSGGKATKEMAVKKEAAMSPASRKAYVAAEPKQAPKAGGKRSLPASFAAHQFKKGK